MESTSTLARLRGVDKRYGATRALDGFDLSLHAGQVTALLGTNGAGKSTAVGLLLGLLAADAGEVSVLGGVRVGRGSVVAAGAVVSRSVPADSIAMGVPAAVVRSRR